MNDFNIDRGLPASPDAEKAILGAIILENSLYVEAAGKLHVEYLFLDAHRRIYVGMGALTEAGKCIDTLTLAEELSRSKELESVGGVAYLSTLTDGVPRRASIEHYIRIVRDKAILRNLVNLGSGLVNSALDASEKPDTLVESMQGSLRDLAAEDQSDLQLVRESTDETLGRFESELRRTDEIAGYPIGLSTVDGATGGVRDTELMLVGGRPGAGKTHVLIQSALANGNLGRRVAIFSLEMKKWQVEYRLWQHEAHIPTAVMRDKRLMNTSQRQAFKSAAVRVAGMPIYIYDGSDLTTEKILAKAAMAVMREKIELVLVDYGQLLVAKGKDEVERAMKQARALDRLAKEFCPVIAAVQLSRAPQNDINRWPNMQDVKGSSQWEQDADIIALIHRPRRKDDPRKMLNEDVFILEKQRESDGVKVEPVEMSEWGEFRPRFTGSDIS